MDNAGQPFRPVLLSGKEYDAVTAALLPLLEEMKRHHAERRRRGDRRTRKTASLLQRGSGAGFLGFLGFLHKFTISFREPYRHDDHGPSLQPLARFGRGFARTQKQRHKQALIDSPRFKAKFPAHAGEFFAEAQIGCLGRERLWARPPDRALAPCWSPSLRGKSRPMRVTSFAR